MLNSMNYVVDEKIIRSGEIVAADSNLKDPAVKTFYHQVAGARSYLPDGAQIDFTGGQYSTKNPDILRFLEAIVDRPGSLVFSRKPGSHISQEAIEAALEVAQPAGNSANIGGQNTKSPAAAALLAQISAAKSEKPVAVTEVEVQAAAKQA